jgi:uncharacterized protein YcbX
MLADVHHLVKILLRIAADYVSLIGLDLVHFLTTRSGDFRHMASTDTPLLGSIAGLWRYPVKSMLGEELDVAEVTERGLLGDRAYALIDVESGQVVSAKNPRKWGNLFDFRSNLLGSPLDNDEIPPARITLPDGTTVRTDDPGLEDRLSDLVGRAVRLASSPPLASRIEGYWPDFDFIESPDTSFQVELPAGTFFDGSLLHFITTATLERLSTVSPQSAFDVRRFRPNMIIEVPDNTAGFVEDGWVGRTIAIGDEVRLMITHPCPRCVMTTLPQGDLPKDPNVLRTAVQQNRGNVGVNAAILHGGRIQRGDVVAMA